MKGYLACLQQTRSAERLPQIVTVFCSWKPQNKKSTKVSYNLNICNKFVIYERQVPILHIFFHLSTKCVKKERKTYIWYPLILYLVCLERDGNCFIRKEVQKPPEAACHGPRHPGGSYKKYRFYCHLQRNPYLQLCR